MQKQNEARYAIYKLDSQTSEVTILDTIKGYDAGIERMRELALEFLSKEEGEKKAKILTDFNHEDILHGYILIQIDSNRIDVYYKKFVKSLLWYKPNGIEFNKIEHYSLSKLPE